MPVITRVDLAEAQFDLALTIRDIARLEAIVTNLELFMREGGEDRSACKTDLLKYHAFLEQGRQLKEKIHAHISKLEKEKASK